MNSGNSHFGKSVTYLNDRETEYGGSNVADEHGRKGSNKHVCKQYSSGLSASFAQDERCKTLVDFALG